MAITNVYCTLANYKYYADISSTDANDDTIIEKIIEGVSRYIDRKTGRTFYARTETHYFDLPKTRVLTLDDDLLSVTTLTNGDENEISSDDYYLLDYNRTPYFAIGIHDYSTTFWEASTTTGVNKCIQLAGSWGFSSSAPTDIEDITMEISKSVYGRRKGKNMGGTATITGAGVVITPSDISDYAKDILKHFRRRF